jgi:hypothetical protein
LATALQLLARLGSARVNGRTGPMQLTPSVCFILRALSGSGFLGNVLSMIADVRKLVSTDPFVPFTIHFADGGQARVPAVDQVYVFPQGSRVLMSYDDDSYDIVSPLLISRIMVDRPRLNAT